MDKSRREELKRTYVESKRPAGIYQIRNKINGKIYIGASVDIPSRINRHKAEFEFNSGNIPALLADGRKYGSENFEYEVLETLDDDYETTTALMDDLKLLEQMWLDKCEPYDDKGYNTRVQ